MREGNIIGEEALESAYTRYMYTITEALRWIVAAEPILPYEKVLWVYGVRGPRNLRDEREQRMPLAEKYDWRVLSLSSRTRTAMSDIYFVCFLSHDSILPTRKILAAQKERVAYISLTSFYHWPDISWHLKNVVCSRNIDNALIGSEDSFCDLCLRDNWILLLESIILIWFSSFVNESFVKFQVPKPFKNSLFWFLSSFRGHSIWPTIKSAASPNHWKIIGWKFSGRMLIL